MSTPERLQEIEQARNFKYPASFLSMLEEFTTLVSTESFRRAFPDSWLLLSAAEVAAVPERTHPALLPFMREEQPPWPDIYAFDPKSPGPEFRVVVWSDHAIVMDWENFSVFFQWVREHVAKHDPTL